MLKHFREKGNFIGLVSIILLLCFGLVYIFWVPLFLIFLILFLACGLEVLKLAFWLGSNKKSYAPLNTGTPKVSVHLAVYNEPAHMVIQTLRSILAQNYADFEIVVVDNNTKDKEVWEPVKKFCEPLSNVRFFHLSNWPFYKSGALNFARKVTDPRAEFLFVVDADYQLCQDALTKAVQHVEGLPIALVQFPQAYHCMTKNHVPVIEEFDHFFDYYCNKANSCYGVLATGTLSLIRLSALDRVGGWPVDSITEDAELGARLQAAGFDIKYVNYVVGKGIVPIYQRDFLQQRKRWIFGNIQTLTRFSISPLKHFYKWLSGVSQLTAWANLLGLPLLLLCASVLVYPFISHFQYFTIVLLSYVMLWLFVVSKLVQLFLVDISRPSITFKTFLVHFAVLDIGAFYWWPVLLGKKRPFSKTDKSGSSPSYTANLFYPLLHAILFVWAYRFGDFILAANAIFFSILHVLAALNDYQCRNGNEGKLSIQLKLQL